LTAGLVAKAIGLPYKRIIAATNVNDTVPRFLASGHWEPRLTVATITNAMDVSNPNNFPRVLEMDWSHGLQLSSLLSSCALTDEETRDAIRNLWQQGYLADPHSALAWAALDRSIATDEEGVFLCTAHSAKFIEVMKETLGVEIPLPPELEAVRDKEVLSSTIPADFETFRKFLLERL
jgi:threonine synthase